jgi:hypothetical protein
MRKVRWARLVAVSSMIGCAALAWYARSLELRLEAVQGEGEWRIVDYELSSSPAVIQVTLEKVR